MRRRSTALVQALANSSSASRCAGLGSSTPGQNSPQAAPLRCFSTSSSTSILSAPQSTASPRSTVPANSASSLNGAGSTRSTSSKAHSSADPLEESEDENESSWAFGGREGNRRGPDVGRRSATYDSQETVDAATAKEFINTPNAPFVVKGNAGKGAVPHYGRRRADVRYNAEEYKAANRDEVIAGNYRHDYAPTSRSRQPLPHHTYFSSPSNSFNDDAAATAAGEGPVGVGGPRSGLGMGAGMHETGKVRGKKSISRKITALILPGQGSQYVAMSLDIYRKYRSARETWSIAEEALLLKGDKRKSKYPPEKERASSEEQRSQFERELTKSDEWDSMKEMTSAGSTVAKGTRGWLRDLVFSGDQLNLTRAENAQISTLVSSLSILSALRQEFSNDLISNHIDFVAGHGSGVYAALCATGALDIRDGVRVLRHRGLTTSHFVLENKTLFPEGCTPPESIYETWAFANAGSGKGAELMLTSIGIDRGEIPPTNASSDAKVVEKELQLAPKRGWKRSQMSGCMIRPGKLEETLKAIEALSDDIKAGKKAGVSRDEIVEVANINSSLQIVLSGTRVGVSLASDMLRDKSLGARAVNLPVSGPYHSSLLNDAAEFLKPVIAYLPLQTPAADPKGRGYNGPLKLISSMKGARALESVEAIREDLSGALVKPVMWLETIEKLLENGVQRFICLGPGRACAHLLSKELAYRDRLNISQGKDAGQFEVWSVTSVEDVEQIGDMLTQLSLDEENQVSKDEITAQ
ncbi:hypothetical protein CBS101457_006280 [Exobasidium rhododendri]|nr:hypothetical protein CBS101457_006280 [Exobasidium rhododendri]